jgi:DNA-binding MarR family transcriptional regulator
MAGARPRAAQPSSRVFDDISSPVHARVVELLLKLSSGLRRFAWDRAAEAGLTPTQAEILRTLQRAPRGLRMGEVAAALGVSPPTVSDAVSALENKCLLLRQPDLNDRRVLRLMPTPQGSVLASGLDDWFDAVATAVATLPARSEAQLLTMLMHVLVTLQKTDGMPTAKMCVTCRHFSPNVSPDSILPHRCELVGAPFGDHHLRVDCPEQEPAPTASRTETWMDSAKHERAPSAGRTRQSPSILRRRRR